MPEVDGNEPKPDHGLVIHRLVFTDEETGRELCTIDWSGEDAFSEEKQQTLSSEMLQCEAVCRTMTFSSAKELRDTSILQRVLFNGEQIETWSFKFGYVIPNSTNTWASITRAAEQMIPPQILSGKMVIETTFYDAQEILAVQRTRCFFK
eukprot:TRINITY_DN23144_c0_g1_i1.p1 TRINITY_DN23144_c0_g1~~TRINITY_DN23144_c0_g1_i1.p1  ORF type:complete len:150 (+),score=18.86 TRINITY_DN23144_c0_g1_i1:61-510(+)